MMVMTRRRFATAAAAAMLAVRGGLGGSIAARAAAGAPETFAAELKRLEIESGGRLGVAVLDTGTGAVVGQRMDERFAMCSTFKLLATAAILARADAGKDDLSHRIVFKGRDLVAYSPVTKDRAGGDGMRIDELCEAAMTRSDNTAANLLVARLGGPAKVTAFARRLGDKVTRLDRIEPGLNLGRPGDERDTTAPKSMAANLQALVLGNVLSQPSRDTLTAWLVGNKTGDTRLRAGLPASWRLGDKTGTGSHGTANDIAIVWPPQRAPVIVSVYLTGASVNLDGQNAVIASVGRAAAALIGV
ncbi:class A beta-lactamase [Bradyrhizobium sp. WD16]|uniref:class A beta-lactamase n=1 Tax=Bradyrhizobium sp. WD16 TaxID=1521768 RepID=UPI003531D2B3